MEVLPEKIPGVRCMVARTTSVRLPISCYRLCQRYHRLLEAPPPFYLLVAITRLANKKPLHHISKVQRNLKLQGPFLN